MHNLHGLLKKATLAIAKSVFASAPYTQFYRLPTVSSYYNNAINLRVSVFFRSFSSDLVLQEYSTLC